MRTNGEKRDDIGLKHRKNDFSRWYPEVVLKSGMADYSVISGCMVIKPYAYEIWETIQKYFNEKIKETGHKNAYFPLFIPERFLKKEAAHFEGFVPEVAWIEEENEKFALRPTSETIINDSFSKWIRSWRDLPMLINQWCNIIRWETKVTRLFLRTREFLWQEGHTAHATKEEADEEVMLITGFYKDLMENQLAVPVMIGKKTESEKFAGALYTMSLESLMPDGRALQMGTSHNLGQNFAKAFSVRFLDKDEKKKHVWQTSWGISTRLIGSVIMTHGDDKGLVLPPNIAPIQVVIVPILFEETKKKVLEKARKIEGKLKKKFRVLLDDREEYSSGWKFNEWEMKGVPLRIEVGPEEVNKSRFPLIKREKDNPTRGTPSYSEEEDLLKDVEKVLKEVQNDLFRKAKKFLKENVKDAANLKEFEKLIREKKMIRAKWCGDSGCERKIKDKTSATIRFIEEHEENLKGTCICCKNKIKEVVYFAKAY